MPGILVIPRQIFTLPCVGRTDGGTGCEKVKPFARYLSTGKLIAEHVIALRARKARHIFAQEHTATASNLGGRDKEFNTRDS